MLEMGTSKGDVFVWKESAVNATPIPIAAGEERLVRYKNSFSSTLRQNRQILRSWSSCKFASF